MVWSVEQAATWYAAQGEWKQGVNFMPSYAVNQIHMWQEYNATLIAHELEWAANLNYNAVRVFLHDQMYTYEGDAFLDKVDVFLETADREGMQTILVLLEGIWDPNPQYVYGESQPAPRPFVHNSRWLQSPGADALQNDTLLETQTRPYVEAVVRRFGNDTRVLMLDIMDQPDNFNLLSYGAVGERVPAAQDAYDKELEPAVKLELIQRFIPKLIKWAEEADPYRQVPLTIADWHVEDEVPTLAAAQDDLRQLYLNSSDIITFHHYGPDVLTKLQALQAQFPGRPVVLSSFLARDDGSHFDPILGDMYQRNVWAMNWGLVSGAIQTTWNSDSWNERYVDYPEVWHHDVLWPNGTVYKTSEEAYLMSFRQLVDGGGTPETPPVTTGGGVPSTTMEPPGRVDPTPAFPTTAAGNASATTPATTGFPNDDLDTNQTLAPSRKPATPPKEVNPPETSSWLQDSSGAPTLIALTALGGLLLCIVITCYCCQRRCCIRRQRRLPAFEVCEQDGDDEML